MHSPIACMRWVKSMRGASLLKKESVKRRSRRGQFLSSFHGGFMQKRLVIRGPLILQMWTLTCVKKSKPPIHLAPELSLFLLLVMGILV